DAKYSFNFWRPITAIQMTDPNWQPLLNTPPYPDYPSGQCTFAGAYATTLAALFGDDPGVPFVPTSPANPTRVPTWTRFSDGVREAIDARVDSGIHFRTADVDGARLGREVARYVLWRLGER